MAEQAITSVASDEENDLRGIEKALGRAIPHVTQPGFDYRAPPPPKRHGREDRCHRHDSGLVGEDPSDARTAPLRYGLREPASIRWVRSARAFL